ncbi:hypothetical protein JCM15519_26950 [Fundidesulfovibrio butyratiphilus]
MAYIGAKLEAVHPEPPTPLLPAGEYPCVVTDSLLIKSRAGRPLLKLVHEVTEGPYAGRKIFDGVLLDHEPGLARLKMLAIKSGHPNPNFVSDSEELHGLRFVARLSVETGDDGETPLRNQVRAYKALDSRTSVPSDSQDRFRAGARQVF